MAISKDQALRPYVQELGNAFEVMEELAGRFRFGTTEEATIEAETSYSELVTYDVPFDQSATSVPFIGFTDGIVPTNISVSIVESSNSGFRYTVHNAGERDATVRLGYMGVRVG